MNRAGKKDRLRGWRAEEREAAKARLPLPDSEMQALFDMLDQRLPEAGCDHTRRLTDGWLRARDRPVEEVHPWLDGNGGFCDCEVLANAEQAWRAASGRK